MSTDRAYDNRSRAEAALATRRRIIDAAREMLLRDGYHAMSVSQLASSAGVSAQTVYNAIGGKAAVVKAVYDVMLVGDDEPVAMQDRPEFRAMSQAPDREGFVRAYAALCATIYERVGPLLGVLLAQGAGGDVGLQDFVATIDRERRAGNTNALNALERAHGLPLQLDRQRFIDIVWTVTAPEIYDRFVRRSGWTHAMYAAWLAEALVAIFDRASVRPAAGVELAAPVGASTNAALQED
ncbi:TetR/AcrR family transcriptional regulator [Terrabacter sp. MAHUQ-38]|jgi:AcrR family transcriptional regulator|uniref:TetR/AcrR family transcriptional regulator n=1 Tax=unclassified Terrabacter TaxID=2630222 RepID=UPI0021079DF8|nr:helix-turn-helix domain-containing protein [Terrabacter sp. MAHUQ-38]